MKSNIMTINQSAPIVSPRHTSRLIVSLVINGHDTDAASVSKVLGSSFYTLKESMPFLSHFTCLLYTSDAADE